MGTSGALTPAFGDAATGSWPCSPSSSRVSTDQTCTADYHDLHVKPSCPPGHPLPSGRCANARVRGLRHVRAPPPRPVGRGPDGPPANASGTQLIISVASYYPPRGLCYPVTSSRTPTVLEHQVLCYERRARIWRPSSFQVIQQRIYDRINDRQAPKQVGESLVNRVAGNVELGHVMKRAFSRVAAPSVKDNGTLSRDARKSRIERSHPGAMAIDGARSVRAASGSSGWEPRRGTVGPSERGGSGPSMGRGSGERLSCGRGHRARAWSTRRGRRRGP
jgi:hypothetical protein